MTFLNEDYNKNRKFSYFSLKNKLFLLCVNTIRYFKIRLFVKNK